MSSSARRLKKSKERERRNRATAGDRTAKRLDKFTAMRIKQCAPLPEFTVSPDMSTELRDLILPALSKFKSDYVRLLPEDVIIGLAEHRRRGWSKLINNITNRTDSLRNHTELSVRGLFETEIGDALLRCSSDSAVQRVLAVNNYTLNPTETGWTIDGRSLIEICAESGRAYQSPNKPTIRPPRTDRLLELVFSRHAILQLADRIIPRWSSHYLSTVYVFGFIYECVYFEPTVLPDGQAGIVIYNSCLRAGNDIRELMRQLVGLPADGDLTGYYYRIGYCPITHDGNYAVAKTFLTPGYRNTPERVIIDSPKYQGKKVLADVEMAADDGINVFSMSKCDKTRKAIMWLHNHGAPQIHRIDREVFKTGTGPSMWTVPSRATNSTPA